MKKQIMMIAATVALFAAGRSAQATLVESGTASFVSTSSGTIDVNYFVDLTGSTYTYVYEFNAVPAISDFEVNASYVSSVLTSGNATIGTLATADLGAGATPYTGASTSYTLNSLAPSSVTWYIIPPTPGQYAFGFTSLLGPSSGSGSLIDESSGPWGDNAGSGSSIPVPAPVPEASTVLAGLLMIVPLGVGAIRASRKERLA